MPIQIFMQVARGIIATLNVTEPPQFKKELLTRLHTPDELGYELDPGLHYGKLAAAYQAECVRMESQEEADSAT